MGNLLNAPRHISTLHEHLEENVVDKASLENTLVVVDYYLGRETDFEGICFNFFVKCLVVKLEFRKHQE